ncbi:MAG: type II toxin-antitoxin system RelE/ParE family toxin [Kiritimatiellae bacterium]|nr:type II toxin-antitoxin system RelE/ParE family toxin [Kiritimatiellia bacterium]
MRQTTRRRNEKANRIHPKRLAFLYRTIGKGARRFRFEYHGAFRNWGAKKIAPNLYEIRVRVSPNQYRLLYCYADGDKVLILSGFVKKTQKTPKAEIEKAQKIRKAAGV